MDFFHNSQHEIREHTLDDYHRDEDDDLSSIGSIAEDEMNDLIEDIEFHNEDDFEFHNEVDEEESDNEMEIGI